MNDREIQSDAKLFQIPLTTDHELQRSAQRPILTIVCRPILRRRWKSSAAHTFYLNNFKNSTRLPSTFDWKLTKCLHFGRFFSAACDMAKNSTRTKICLNCVIFTRYCRTCLWFLPLTTFTHVDWLEQTERLELLSCSFIKTAGYLTCVVTFTTRWGECRWTWNVNKSYANWIAICSDATFSWSQVLYFYLHFSRNFASKTATKAFWCSMKRNRKKLNSKVFVVEIEFIWRYFFWSTFIFWTIITCIDNRDWLSIEVGHCEYAR